MGLSNQQYKKAKKIADMNLKSYILYLIPRFFIFPFIFIFLIILVFEGKVELVISLNASIILSATSIIIAPMIHNENKKKVGLFEAKKRAEENWTEYKDGWGTKIPGTDENNHVSVTNKNSNAGEGFHSTSSTGVFIGEEDLKSEFELTNKEMKKRNKPYNELKYHDYFDDTSNYWGDESPGEKLKDIQDDIEKGFITKNDFLEELKSQVDSNKTPESVLKFFKQNLK